MVAAAEPGGRGAFASTLGFELDPFQTEAIDVLDRGDSVVVAVPTGSGKTVVADYAVGLALGEGRRAFYTTPLKALSNQKYAELVARHGAPAVGLLTGDNVVNPGAPVVVMTTEVLRNMIYASSPALDALRWVVLDEVHYLQNAYRGPVWEEVIIHLPAHVGLVCLSATVSNADELADWIGTVRGPTSVVVETRRPVDLHDLYLVGERGSDRLLLLPTLVEDRANGEAAALTARPRGPVPPGSRRRLFAPRRAETVELLDELGMLPAISFVFSRNACDDAVRQCARDSRPLTTAEERARIREIAGHHVDGLGPADLRLLGHDEWLSGLESGFAAHHAGLVPPFKEAVEACFAAGLIKVVFATETLALGINMPARTVVIEKLTKFTGERHEFLTPAEYTQLTGRAGRRGIDEVGYAVVPWSPWVPFDQVAGLVGTRSYALTSSFRPTYNMAANLVRRYDQERARHLLGLSFAQYRADRDVVVAEAGLERARATLAEAAAEATCERGDVASYRRLVRAARAEGLDRRPAPQAEVAAALEAVRPGDVLLVPGARSAQPVAVLSSTRRRGSGVQVRAVTAERRSVQIGPADFDLPPRPVGRVRLPSPYAPNSSAFRKRVAASLAGVRIDRHLLHAARTQGRHSAPGPGTSSQPASSHASSSHPASSHPVAACPRARLHVRALDRVDRLVGEIAGLEERAGRRPGSLAAQLDRVLAVLDRRGYVEEWELTPAGELLAGLYHECDLLVAEAVERGLLDGLGPADLAAVASMFTFEARGRSEGPPTLTSGRLRQRWHDVERLAAGLQAEELAAGLPPTRSPDPGFAAIAGRWASGEDLAPLLGDGELSGGDFVRNVKQLVDLLRQLGERAPDPATRSAARSAVDRLLRGVVAAGSVVGR